MTTRTRILGGSAVLLVLGVVVLALFPPRALVLAGFEFERQRHGLDTRVASVGALDWPYLAGGPSGGETIVLLHGFGADKDIWMRFAGALTGDYRVLIPDLPGFGDATRNPELDHRVPAQARRLRAFLAALDTGPVHLAGNSMGGHLAALYALQYPAQVRSLGLFNPAGVTEPTPSPQTTRLRAGDNPMRIDTMADYDTLMQFVAERPPFVPPPAKRLMAQRAMRDAELHDRILSRLLADESARLDNRLGDIAAPALIVWGRHDRAIDVSAAAVWHAGLPRAQLRVYEDLGHIPMAEAPKRTARDYREFLTQLPDADTADGGSR